MEEAGRRGAFRGTAVHEHWQPSLTSQAWDQALCNAHHLRARQCLAKPYPQPWANAMAALLRAIPAAVAVPPAPALGVAPWDVAACAQHYDARVQAGCAANPAPGAPTEGEEKKPGRPTHAPPGNLLSRLRDFTRQVLACMYAFRVPFDNHQGARDIRMVPVKQQGAGGVRTLEGAQRCGRMRGDISTASTHAKHVCEAMRDACEGNPFRPSPATP
jgi:transposase